MLRTTITCLLLLITNFATAASLETGIDEQAKLPYWEIRDADMSLRLVQRLPIQTRGYFQARGFNKQQSELIAQSCAFQTILKNTSNQGKHAIDIEYDLKTWRVITGNSKHRLKTREDWKSIWQAKQVSTAAQVAFEWSLLPTRQQYQAGDYNWGITLFALKPGSKFNLEVIWKQRDKTKSKAKYFLIKNIQCAPDINPQPEGIL